MGQNVRKLYELKNYLIDIDYIFSVYIYEFDISKANINILLWKNAITKELYDLLYNSSREYRQVQVGYMLKDNALSKILEQGLIDAKKLFFESNNLNDEDIFSIKNDAIFILNKFPKITKFDNIEFVLKNTYTTYIKFMRKLELYYHSNKVHNTQVIDIKGINDKTLELHKNYMLDILCYILYLVELGNLEEAVDVLKTFMIQYSNRELDIGYYRNFNAESNYIVNANGKMYGISDIDDNNKSNINISYNLNILRELYSILTNLYFSRKKVN